MGGKAKPPKPPDLAAANKQQMEANKNAAYDVMGQNSYTQQSPYGSNTWTTDPVTGQRTNTTALSPEQQALYMGNNALAQQMTGGASGALGNFMQQYYGGGGTGGGGGGGYTGGGSSSSAGGGGGMLPGFGSFSGSSSTTGSNIPGGIYAPDAKTKVGGVGGDIRRDLDLSSLTGMPTTDPAAARQEAQDALYKMNTQYLDPQFAAQQKSLETKLSNQGLVPGTEAYNRAAQIQNDASQKAYESARQGAIAGGGAEAERAQNMALALRNQGMSEEQAKFTAHNLAQNQRASQLLADTGQQRTLQGQLGAAQTAAGASMANAQLANQLGTRNQSFNELLQMGQFGRGSEKSPSFTTSQGNLGSYGTGDAVNAANADYRNQQAYQQAKGQSGLGGMLPMIGQMAGTYFGGPLLGQAAGALGGQLFGGGGLNQSSNHFGG